MSVAVPAELVYTSGRSSQLFFLEEKKESDTKNFYVEFTNKKFTLSSLTFIRSEQIQDLSKLINYFLQKKIEFYLSSKRCLSGSSTMNDLYAFSFCTESENVFYIPLNSHLKLQKLTAS